MKKFHVRDCVKKVTGDYQFFGMVVSVFYKRDNATIRYVVENDAGILHIFSGNQLELDEK